MDQTGIDIKSGFRRLVLSINDKDSKGSDRYMSWCHQRLVSCLYYKDAGITHIHTVNGKVYKNVQSNKY